MSTVRDERQRRVDEMIVEFRSAQARRATTTTLNDDDQVVALQPEADTGVSLAVSTATPRSSHENGGVQDLTPTSNIAAAQSAP